MGQRKPLLDWADRPLLFFAVEIVDVLALENSSRPAPVYIISTLAPQQERKKERKKERKNE